MPAEAPTAAGARTRRSLLDAGVAVAEAHGLAGLSVNRVVAEAGVAIMSHGPGAATPCPVTLASASIPASSSILRSSSASIPKWLLPSGRLWVAQTDLQDACPVARKTRDLGVQRRRLSTLLLFSRFVMLPIGGPATRTSGERRELRRDAVAHAWDARQPPQAGEAAGTSESAHPRHAR